MTNSPRPHDTFVEGIVVPIDWGPEGEALRIAILTLDEGEYEVAPTHAGPRLKEALRKKVEARVRVHSRPGERDLVTVFSYAVFNADERLEIPLSRDADDEARAGGEGV